MGKRSYVPEEVARVFPARLFSLDLDQKKKYFIRRKKQ